MGIVIRSNIFFPTNVHQHGHSSPVRVGSKKVPLHPLHEANQCAEWPNLPELDGVLDQVRDQQVTLICILLPPTMHEMLRLVDVEQEKASHYLPLVPIGRKPQKSLRLGLGNCFWGFLYFPSSPNRFLFFCSPPFFPLHSQVSSFQVTRLGLKSFALFARRCSHNTIKEVD